jgi:hypothetical protein
MRTVKFLAFLVASLIAWVFLWKMMVLPFATLIDGLFQIGGAAAPQDLADWFVRLALFATILPALIFGWEIVSLIGYWERRFIGYYEPRPYRRNRRYRRW